MFVTIINDCQDENARARQESRVASLIQSPTTFLGVNSDIEASMQIIDILDATEGAQGLILVNVAPRGTRVKKWENGTPFGYFKFNNTIVITSIDGYTLSAIKNLRLATTIDVFDIRTCAKIFKEKGLIDEKTAIYLPRTQFRSFDFTPRAGAYLLKGGILPTTTLSLDKIPDLPNTVWHIDNFGNCKTTLLSNNYNDKGNLTTRFGTFPIVSQLRHLDDGQSSIVIGSSGIGEYRFLELMSQRKNFSSLYNVHIGDDIFDSQSHFITATK
jgi:hypothetical protein